MTVAAVAAATGPARPEQYLLGPQRAESAALARAERTGRPVVVSALTTPTVEVTAHPGGLLSMKSNVFPVRAKVHGVWRAIDPTLRPTAGGSWKPAVSDTPLTFSGGGRGPLVTVADPNGRTVSMYWPAALPRPAVSGPVALYRNVLPGVDLRLAVSDTGYQETLVVRDAAAAADPRLRSLTFTVKAARGLVLRPGPGATLNVIDAKTGGQIFFVGRPTMWDSTRAWRGALRPTADSAGGGRVTQVPVGYRMAGAAMATISMAPPAGALTGKHVRYPLFIDPSIQKATDFYAEVLRTDAGFTENWNPPHTSLGSNQVQVGYCGYDTSYSHPCFWNNTLFYTNRVYFRFDTDVLEVTGGQKAHIYWVSFDDEQTINSDGCTARLTDLYSTTGGIDGSTNWPGPQGDKIGVESSNNGGGSGCRPGNVEWDSDDSGDEGLLSTIQSSADNSDQNIAIELRADAENDKFQYKGYMNNPQLSVYFNFPPPAPTALNVPGQVTCDPTAAYISNPDPTLVATPGDNNPSPLNLKVNFTLETSAGGPAGGTLPTPPPGAPNVPQSTTPSTPLADGAYQFQATATNQPVGPGPENITIPPLTGPASDWYPFTVLTAPIVAPTISSFDYPPKQWGQAMGVPGVFTLGANGASNIAGFAYSFDGGTSSEPIPKATDCGYLNNGGLGTSVDSNGDGLGSSNGELALGQGGTAHIEAPANLAEGQHTLFVESFDKAHNASAEATYTFYVPPNSQTTSQPVTFIDGSSLAAGATGPNASLVTTQNDCCGVSWRDGSQLIFNGTALSQSFTVTINVPDTGWWQIGANLTRAANYGQAKVDLDQATSDINLAGTSTVPWDGYAPTVSLAYRDLGTQHLTAGTHTLTFTMTGQNASSSGFKAGINYITLSPTNRYEAEVLSHPTPATGTLAPQYLASVPWSAHGDLAFTNTVVGSTFSVKFDVPVAAPYAIGINLVTGPTEGTLQIDLDGVNLDNTATTPLDAYSKSINSTYVFLGGPTLTAGTHVLQFTLRGTNASSIGDQYDAGIDYIEAAPVTAADLALTP